jgi:thioredoxin-like negative regulator of GroEL
MRHKLGFLVASVLLASCEPAVPPPYVSMSGPPPAVALPAADAVLVVFWASWCAPCRKELPDLAQLADEPPVGLQIVGFSQDTSLEVAQSFLAQIGASRLTTRIDPEGSLAEEFGVQILPGAVLVVRGELKARFDGAQRWNAGPMRDLLTRLAAG